MKVSKLWLEEWVDSQWDVETLANKLTMSGLEVDGVYPAAASFSGVVVARVNKVTAHPDASRLSICQVETGNELLQIVCGAHNVREGLYVALAKIGAKLPGGLDIKPTILRGVESNGMLCASSELGMTEKSNGILELDDSAPLGQDIRQYLQLDDHIIDIDITANRADCFSILGVAREVRAIGGFELLRSQKASTTDKSSSYKKTVIVEVSKACPHYCGRVIKNINLTAKTPDWMAERLRRGGVRCSHPVVDVLNYVMLELGQPMHAFDLEALSGDITVRYARRGENLELINEQTVELDEQVLIIADSNSPLAIAGIMGGKSSAVTEKTVDLFIESAFFTPDAIAGEARRFSLCTDSSMRFERGVDPTLALDALEYATLLLTDIVGGEPSAVVGQKAEDFPAKAIEIDFDPSLVSRITGQNIAPESMQQILMRLGMRINNNDTNWTVAVPSYRFDIFSSIDLVEEILRLYGYEEVLSTKNPDNGGYSAIGDDNDFVIEKLKRFIAAQGYHETISYSFVDPELQQLLYPDIHALRLLNPISKELSDMRVSLWPGLIASMIYNLHRQQMNLRLFEVGTVFEPIGNEFVESTHIAGLLTGSSMPLNWSLPERQLDFFDIKGDFVNLLESYGYEHIVFEGATHPALHPGRCACVKIDNNVVGWVGALHPEIIEALDCEQEVLIFDLQVDVLLKGIAKSYHTVSKFPRIRRDLSILMDKSIPVGDILECIRANITSPQLRGINVFDVYSGELIPEDKKSIGLALMLQNTERTMTDADANNVINAILDLLFEKFAIVLRE